jgi:hypothetical protein
MSDYWAKIYIEILDDPKMAVMPDRVWRRTIELFLVAKKINQNGNIPETKQIAWMLRLPTDEVELDLQQIASTGIIQRTLTGWFIPKFCKRQAASTNTERSQAFREKQHKEQYYDDNETDLKRFVAQRTDNRLTENREQKTEQSDPPDAFSDIQHAIEHITQMMPDNGACKAINEIIAMGAVEEDLRGGYDWLTKNNKQFKYYSQLVGPTRTAMAMRTQGNHKGGRSSDLSGIHFDNVRHDDK